MCKFQTMVFFLIFFFYCIGQKYCIFHINDKLCVKQHGLMKYIFQIENKFCLNL